VSNLNVLKLKKNLRRNILQGNPWVYQDAISSHQNIKSSTLCKVNDMKNDFLGWGVYSPNSPLALRMISLEKSPPNKDFFKKKIIKAWALREGLRTEANNAYRFINGEGDLLPGVICDIYASVAVLQFDGADMSEYWDACWIAEWVLKNTNATTVYFKPRHDMKSAPKTWGDELPDLVEIMESGSRFYVDIVNGQKTGFFLDQRENRSYIKNISKDKLVANLFSYSGGFSICAGLGGAKRVTSVDIAGGALELANKNWALNNLKTESHRAECADVFDWLTKNKNKYDIVICDPPSLAKSEKQKDQAVKKYVEAFSLAARSVKENGHLVLSSCSSHISFEDFKNIADQALSKARLRGQILKVSGQGPDHPYTHACEHLRYLKFMDIVVYK